MSALHAEVAVAARRLDATLHADAGETVAVMGPSGAGKSTLVEAIAGLVPLSGGVVRIGARTVADPRPRVPVHRRGTVLLGQDPRLFPHLSARDNVAFGPRSRGVEKAAASHHADELLWRVGLGGAGHHRPSELSGGQRQRVALARALAVAPDVLLLDEPLTSLDPETADGIRAVLADVLHGVTTVLVTHDAVDAASLASRIVVLEAGHVTQQGAVRDVLNRPATPFAAALSGVNRVTGRLLDGRWVAAHDGGAPVVLEGVAPASGRDGDPLVAVFRPGAVRIAGAAADTWTGVLRLDAAQPGRWHARVTRLEQTPSGVRVHTDAPNVVADLPVEVVADLGLRPGIPVALAVDPADVRLLPG